MARKRNKYIGTHEIFNMKVKKAFYNIYGENMPLSHSSQLYVLIKCSGRKDGDEILRSVGLIGLKGCLTSLNSCETGNTDNMAVCDKSAVGIAISPIHSANKEMLTWETIKEYMDTHDV